MVRDDLFSTVERVLDNKTEMVACYHLKFSSEIYGWDFLFGSDSLLYTRTSLSTGKTILGRISYSHIEEVELSDKGDLTIYFNSSRQLTLQLGRKPRI